MDSPSRRRPRLSDNSYVQFAATVGPISTEEKEYRIRKGVQRVEEDSQEYTETLSFHLTGEIIPGDAEFEQIRAPIGAENCQSPSATSFSISDMVEKATKVNAVAAITSTPVGTSLAPVQELDEDEGMNMERLLALAADEPEEENLHLSNINVIPLSPPKDCSFSTPSGVPYTQFEVEATPKSHRTLQSYITPKDSSNRCTGIAFNSNKISTPLRFERNASATSSLFVNVTSLQDLNSTAGSESGENTATTDAIRVLFPAIPGDFCGETEDVLEESKLTEIESLCEAMDINDFNNSDAELPDNSLKAIECNLTPHMHNRTLGCGASLYTPRPPEICSLLVNLSTNSSLQQGNSVSNTPASVNVYSATGSTINPELSNHFECSSQVEYSVSNKQNVSANESQLYLTVQGQDFSKDTSQPCSTNSVLIGNNDEEDIAESQDDPCTSPDSEDSRNSVNKENESPKRMESFYVTCASDTELDDTITNMERLLALAEEAEIAEKEGTALSLDHDLAPFPINLPCSFIEDVLAENGQGEELRHNEDFQMETNSECQLEELILSPAKAKENSKKMGFKKILNERVLSPLASLSPVATELAKSSPSPKSTATPSRVKSNSPKVPNIFKTPAVPNKTPSRYRRVDELIGNSPATSSGTGLSQRGTPKEDRGSHKKYSTSTPLLRNTNPIPLSICSPASTIGYPTPPPSKTKSASTNSIFSSKNGPTQKITKIKNSISPFLLGRKSPGVIQPRLLTLVSPVADYIYNSPPVQLQQQQRSGVRGHLAQNERMVQSLPRKIRRVDDKFKVSSIPIRKASLPVKGQDALLEIREGVSLDQNKKCVVRGDKSLAPGKVVKASPALINFDSPDANIGCKLDALTELDSPALMEFESPASSEPISRSRSLEDSGSDQIEIPVNLPSEPEELQNLLELSMTKIRQSEEKYFKQVKYFGCEKLRDGKERTVEAPIIPFTLSNPIIVLGLSNRENLLAQRHTGQMSESFGTSIIRSEPVIKSSIPSRIATLAQKK